MNTRFKGFYTVTAFLMIALGIFMLVRPYMFARVLFWVVGAICIVHGVVRIIGYFSKDLYGLAFQFDLALGIASFMLGIIIVLNAERLMNIIPLTVGIFTLLSGALKIQSAFDAKRFGLPKWYFLLITALAMVILGVVLVMFPFGSVAAMICTLGVTLMLDGIQNLIVAFCAVRYK